MQKRSPVLKAILITLIILCLLVAAAAGYIFFNKWLNDKQGREKYDEVRQEAVVEVEDENLPPLEIDWDTLFSINPDVIGWIYIECVGISYPIMKSEDNEDYLHANIYRDYFYSGSVFLDMWNSIDFTDPNSIVYGHNMIDGSMFGKVPQILYENAAYNNPYFWILTPQGNYKYQMFSVYLTVPQTTGYSFFSRGDTAFIDWTKEMRSYNTVDVPSYDVQPNDCVVTLSTCGVTSDERILIFGVCVNPPVTPLPADTTPAKMRGF